MFKKESGGSFQGGHSDKNKVKKERRENRMQGLNCVV